MAGLEPPVLNFYCRMWAVQLPSCWGSKPETLKAQSWEGMQGRNRVRSAWLRDRDLSQL